MTARDHLTEIEARERIGRYLTNVMGVREVVEMDRLSWEYFDWLVERIEGDWSGWVAECDRRRGNETLGAALQTWLYWEYQQRELSGLPRPDWMPPFRGEPDFPKPS